MLFRSRELARRDDGVTMNWWKEERGERIFIDFNQNNRDRTIASAYSLRPKPGAPVSTPLRWDEVPGCEAEAFTIDTVPTRVAEIGSVRGHRRGGGVAGPIARARGAARGGRVRRRAVAAAVREAGG